MRYPKRRERMIHSLIAPHIETICRELRTRIDGIRRIVLLGSATNGKAFDTDTSDVDIAIVMDEIPREIWRLVGEAGHEIYRDLPAIPQISVLTTDKVQRWQNFELSYEGRVAAGVLLFDSGRRRDGIVLSREQARAEVVDHYISQATHWLRIARKDRNTTYIRFAEFESSRATCRAFHALLVAKDTDPSPKNIRWHLPELLRIASNIYDIPNRVTNAALAIPADIKGDSRWTLEYIDDPAPDAVFQSRLAVARAWGVIRWCQARTKVEAP